MAKKVYEMSENEKQLYKELKQDVKRANNRIRNLYKLGLKDEPFAVKQLHDYLGSEMIKGLTPSGYISLKKGYNLPQLIGIKRATLNFLDDVSTLTEIKKLKKEYEDLLGVKIDLNQVNTIYRLRNMDWIYDYIPKSEFWEVYAPLTVEYDDSEWIEILYQRNEKLNDVDLKEDLESLYVYVKKKYV